MLLKSLQSHLVCVRPVIDELSVRDIGSQEFRSQMGRLENILETGVVPAAQKVTQEHAIRRMQAKAAKKVTQKKKTTKAVPKVPKKKN